LTLLQAGWIVAAALFVWGIIKLRVYPLVGGGYRAKILCTALFGSGRQLDRSLWTQVSDDSYRILRPFRVRVDGVNRSVTADLFGQFARTAVHRDGLGATLLAARQLVQPALMPAAPAIHIATDWPEGTGSESLRRLVTAAFKEPAPRRLRRTYAMLVVHDGTIVGEQYGPGVHAQMPLPGWSVAKSVLNALTGILVGEGRLELGRRELLREWASPDPRAAISVEDLLRMRSGLRFSEAYANPWSDVLHMLYNCHDTAAYAASLPLAHAPGTVWSYSSGTTNILSRIMREVVGEQAYHTWPRRALFDRIGMSSAVLEPDASGTFVCSSYMLATARDWARFGQLFVDDGVWKGERILPEGWARFSTTPTPQSDGRFGAHWWLKLNPEIGGGSPAAARIPSDAFFAVGHEGQTLTVIPSLRLVVVRLGASIYIDAWNHAEFIANLQDVVRT
jgi:CubicO group peptidase (beta-lactamase class C family)